MVLAWCLAQASLNAMFAALTATVPDLVPVRERGVVGGWVAVSQTLGIVAGVGIATVTGGIAAGLLRDRGRGASCSRCPTCSAAATSRCRRALRPAFSAAGVPPQLLDLARGGTPTSRGPG